MTRQLLEGLVRLPELMEPVAEAAQEVLETRDEEDREAISQARQRLLAVLDDSAELTAVIHRLLAVVRSPDPLGPSWIGRFDTFRPRSRRPAELNGRGLYPGAVITA